MTKQELYDALKNDGARLQRAVNFMNRDELVELYTERFGVNPDCDAEQPNSEPVNPNTEEAIPNSEPEFVKIPLLKFADSGWCNELNKAYSCGLYRPKDADEYIALKKYAAEEIYA